MRREDVSSPNEMLFFLLCYIFIFKLKSNASSVEALQRKDVCWILFDALIGPFGQKHVQNKCYVM